MKISGSLVEPLVAAASPWSAIPERFYAGQRYAEDTRLLPCSILTWFNCASTVSEEAFWYHGMRVTLSLNPPHLIVRIERKISRNLWRDAILRGEGTQFVLGYVADVLPEVNDRMRRNRYATGHVLSASYGMTDAVSLRVLRAGFECEIDWPKTIANFPPLQPMPLVANTIFIRDYIDAMNSYFKSDFDECIRRIITSAENLFRKMDLRDAKGGGAFRGVLLANLDQTSFSRAVIFRNMAFVYGIRNKIVHGQLRIKPEDGWFCYKAIASLKYLIQMLCDPDTVRYTNHVYFQLVMLRQAVGLETNLDWLRREFAGDHLGPDHRQVINSMAEMDAAVFSALEFSHKERSMLFKKRRR